VLKKKYLMLLQALTLAVLLSSCAHIRLSDTWKDPGYQGHPQKVLVLAMARSKTVEIMFENQLVEQLERHGLIAVAGHDVLPDDLALQREALKRAVKEKDIDTIFIAGPTNRQDLKALRPGERSYADEAFADPSTGNYLNYGGPSYDSGIYVKHVNVEMVLYDVRLNKRIWSALGDIKIWDTPEKEIQPAVKHIMEVLISEKIIPL